MFKIAESVNSKDIRNQHKAMRDSEDGFTKGKSYLTTLQVN